VRCAGVKYPPNVLFRSRACRHNSRQHRLIALLLWEGKPHLDLERVMSPSMSSDCRPETRNVRAVSGQRQTLRNQTWFQIPPPPPPPCSWVACCFLSSVGTYVRVLNREAIRVCLRDEGLRQQRVKYVRTVSKFVWVCGVLPNST
jgi:hypothetical protein